MKNFFTLLLIACCLPSIAQVNVNITTDYIPVTTTFVDSVYNVPDSYIFSKRLIPYSTDLDTKGLQFLNNTTTIVNNTLTILDVQSHSLIGAQGANTKVIFKGKSYLKEGGSSRAHVIIKTGGHFFIHRNAEIDFILPISFFTRQFWISGDGTGKFELDEGFVADHTDSGTVAKGVGSLRVSNSLLITHHTQSLPLGFRPNSITNAGRADINSHLVFEDKPGSIWRVLTNDQDYKGGLWIYVNTCFDTQKNLKISGKNSVWADYTNYGGIQMIGANLTLCKTGQGSMILNGSHSYNSGSTIRIDEGTVDFLTDPTTTNAGFSASNKNDLSLIVESNGKLKYSADSIRIDSLILKPGAVIEANINSTLKGNYASLDGNLVINIPSGTPLMAGDTFHLIVLKQQSGNFSTLTIPNYGGQVVWDTTRLRTEGILIVQSGNIIAGITLFANHGNALKIFPVPTNGYFEAEGKYETAFEIFSLTGTKVFSGKTDQTGKADIISVKPGCYILKFVGIEGVLSTRLMVD